MWVMLLLVISPVRIRTAVASRGKSVSANQYEDGRKEPAGGMQRFRLAISVKARIIFAMIRLLAPSMLALVAAISAAAAEEGQHLSSDQMAKAAMSEAMTVPTPGELFAALGKSGKINWSAQYRAPIPTTYGNRAQIALNLGGLIADGFIAVEAKDGQQVKNIGSDIMKLGKALGVSEQLLSRGNSINEFAENNEWDTVQEELEATENEVKSSMQTHADQDLVILVTLGGWIRGTQVVTAAIMQDYNEDSAKVLRQPALVRFMQSKINEISPELRGEPLVKNVSEQLGEIEKLVSFPSGKAPTVDDVRKVNKSVGKAITEIESKDLPK